MGINLYEWCLENMPDLVDEWSLCQDNDSKMSDFTYRSGKYANWVCKKCGHNWSSKICNRTNGSGCPKCADKKSGQRTIKRQIFLKGSLAESEYAKEWDYDRNDIDIHLVAQSSNTKRYWICEKCGNIWFASPNSRSHGTGCPECAKRISNEKKAQFHINRDGSFAVQHPEFIKFWDVDKNKKSYNDVTVNSTYIAWWKCPDCCYEWQRSVSAMTQSRGCPKCVENQTISSIQRKTQNYIKENYKYTLLNEYNCSLTAINPKTNFKMPYDNEILIDKDNRLLIEVQGEQHFTITAFVLKQATKDGISPQEELKYQQWKDEYKKQFALSNGYYYLAIPYTAFKNDEYKDMIDSEIHKILSTIQNNPKE